MKEHSVQSKHGARSRSNNNNNVVTSEQQHSNKDAAPRATSQSRRQKATTNSPSKTKRLKQSPRKANKSTIKSDNKVLNNAESRSNTTSPASGFSNLYSSDADDVESDPEWDVGVGNLVIDLDADIERSSTSKVNNNVIETSKDKSTSGQAHTSKSSAKQEGAASRNKEFVALLKSDSSNSSGSSCDLSSTFPSLHKAFIEAGGSFTSGVSRTASQPQLVSPTVKPASSPLTSQNQTQTSAAQHGVGFGLLQASQLKQLSPGTVSQVQPALKGSPQQPTGVSTHPAPENIMSSQVTGGGGGSNAPNSNKSGGSVAGSNKSEHSASVDRGLKMKIKRTKNSGSKHGTDGKHEIVKDKNISNSNLGNAQSSTEQSPSNHTHASNANSVNSSGGVTQEKTKHHHHSSNSASEDSSNSGKPEGGKSGKSGRNSQKKNKDKNKGNNSSNTNASTQSAGGPDHLSNGNSTFHGTSLTQGAGTGNPGGAPTSGGANPSGSVSNSLSHQAGITNVSVELDRIAGPPFPGGIKKESVTHDPYEFNAKVEDRPVGLHAMKKIKVEKVRFLFCFV